MTENKNEDLFELNKGVSENSENTDENGCADESRNADVRSREESDIRRRPDRVGRYFTNTLNQYLFVEFSDRFLEQGNLTDILKDVPAPLRHEDFQSFKGGEGISPDVLGKNMAWVIGCDPHFRYAEQYVSYLTRVFGPEICGKLASGGSECAERGDLETACIYFRAALCVKFDDLNAMYSYASACREMYMDSEDEEYTGRFKAESMDWFELVTETHPQFAPGFYYLGYAYVNMGLYSKTKIAWDTFLSLTGSEEDKEEIQARLNQIKDPVQIETACLDIAAGRFERGLEILEPYENGHFDAWWPLHYYLGLGYKQKGDADAAVKQFKRVLSMNGSHLETMNELVEIYRAQNDGENVKKYATKIQLIRQQILEDQERN